MTFKKYKNVNNVIKEILNFFLEKVVNFYVEYVKKVNIQKRNFY